MLERVIIDGELFFTVKQEVSAYWSVGTKMKCIIKETYESRRWVWD